jgi:replication initiation protein RepC
MTRTRIAPGCRRLTPDHCRAAAIAAPFDGLPAGVTKKSQLLAALKQACPRLGISTRLRDAIDTLMSWSAEQDWLGESRPIVWPSNQALQDAWDLSRRQVQNILTNLVRLGLIATVDSPEGRRWGKRDQDGRIIEAYGFDLSPLAVRHAEFVAVAAEHRKACKIRDRLRRRLTIVRKACRQIAETAIEQQVHGRDWSEWGAAAVTIAEQRSRDIPVANLQGLVERLEEVRKEGEAALCAWFDTVEKPPAGAIGCTPNTTTKTLLADKSATCNEAANEPFSPSRRRSAQTANHDQLLPPNYATTGLAPGLLAKLCRPLRTYLADERPEWSAVVNAADYLRTDLGISRSAWIDACHTLGRNDAAAAVAVIAAKRADIASPGGYLRGMTSRARTGRLNLMGSLWGLAEHSHDA